MPHTVADHGKSPKDKRNPKLSPIGFSFGFRKFGSPNRARTCDIMINSHALYRLSYRGIPSIQFSNMEACKKEKTKAENLCKDGYRNASAHRKPNKGRNEGSSRNEAKLEELFCKRQQFKPSVN